MDQINREIGHDRVEALSTPPNFPRLGAQREQVCEAVYYAEGRADQEGVRVLWEYAPQSPGSMGATFISAHDEPTVPCLVLLRQQN